MKQLTIGLLALVALLGACSDAEYQDSSTGPIALDDLPQEYAKAYCRALSECVIPNGEAQLLGVMARSGGDCDVILGDVIRSGGLIDDAKNGLVDYDGAAARVCLDAIANDCAFDGNSLPACEDVFAGKIQEGGSCSFEGRCAPGLYCKTSGGDRCAWECAPVPTEGESCAESFECANEGERRGYCDLENVCQLIETKAAVGVDQRCSDSTEDGTLIPCADGLWCSEDNVCRTPLAVGDACEDNDDYCGGEGLCAEGECRPVTVLNTAGADCSSGIEEGLRVCNWLRELQCVEGKCVLLEERRAGEGEDCWDDPCEEGLYCSYADDETVCRTPMADGERCDWDDDECQSGYCSLDNICEPQSACE